MNDELERAARDAMRRAVKAAESQSQGYTRVDPSDLPIVADWVDREARSLATYRDEGLVFGGSGASVASLLTQLMPPAAVRGHDNPRSKVIDHLIRAGRWERLVPNGRGSWGNRFLLK
jgi:hypothetical protein